VYPARIATCLFSNTRIDVTYVTNLPKLLFAARFAYSMNRGTDIDFTAFKDVAGSDCIRFSGWTGELPDARLYNIDRRGHRDGRVYRRWIGGYRGSDL
jgi:hypothetical protein